VNHRPKKGRNLQKNLNKSKDPELVAFTF